MAFYNGDIYQGNWLNEDMHGQGIMKYKNGEVFEGIWYCGKMNQGRLQFSEGQFIGVFDIYSSRAAGYLNNNTTRAQFDTKLTENGHKFQLIPYHVHHNTYTTNRLNTQKIKKLSNKRVKHA